MTYTRPVKNQNASLSSSVIKSYLHFFCCYQDRFLNSKMPNKRSLYRDERGAMAFEMLIVYSFMIVALLLPLGDMSISAIRFISAWQGLRAFTHYVQFNPPSDVTNTTTWITKLPTNVSGFAIQNFKIKCGDQVTGVDCTASNVTTLPVKYFQFSTSITLTPMILRSVLCTSANSNPCTFTLPYSGRFQ